MSDVLKIIQKSDGLQRVLIVKRADGSFSYQRQWLTLVNSNASDSDVRKWGPLGPDCGIYDSAETAEAEARQRVTWVEAKQDKRPSL